MLEAVRKRFKDDDSVTVVVHNLDNPLPGLGKFDAAVSSFAIHHLPHQRKRALYAEIYDVLNSGGVFCNLEHVSSPTPELHDEFLRRIGYTSETEDPSNKLLRHGDSIGMAAGNWIHRRGLRLEVAGTGAAHRPEALSHAM